jgi:hypothetical protein
VPASPLCSRIWRRTGVWPPGHTVSCVGDTLFPSALPDVDRLGVAPGRRGAGPHCVRNVSLSKRLTPRGNKEKATLWTLNPRNKNRKLCRQRPWSSQRGMFPKFLPTRILRKREVPFKRRLV